jgi:cell division protein ZapB
MLSSRPDKHHNRTGRRSEEPHKFNQLGLDFIATSEYISPPRKENEPMDQELIDVLEKRIGDIVEKYNALKEENSRLNADISRLSSDREGLKSRVDAILGKLDGI